MMTLLEVINRMKETTMEILIAFGIAVVFLVTFDLLALRFGVDSRDEVGDDRHRRLTPKWL